MHYINMSIIQKKTPTRVEKTWGYELWFANDEANNYCGKVLHMYQGHKFSMHFHRTKIETFYVSRGTVALRVVNLATGTVEETTLTEGEAFEVSRLLPHQLEALDGDAVIIEASTFHRDEDSYRLWR